MVIMIINNIKKLDLYHLNKENKIIKIKALCNYN